MFLTLGVQELRHTVSEVTHEYGILETKLSGIEIAHAKELQERDELINKMKEELKNANDLLSESRQESLDKSLERFTPTAADLSRRQKSNMSPTEIYSMYVKTARDLNAKEKECNLQTIQLNNILEELKDVVPKMERSEREQHSLQAANDELQHQLRSLIEERTTINDEQKEAISKAAYLQRENKKLLASQGDMGRQICYLLREVEEMRGGCVVEHDADQSIGANALPKEMIEKRFVTVTDLTDMQSKNVQLLCLVRELTDRLEEVESIQNTMTEAAYEQQIASYERRLKDVEEQREIQNQMLDTCVKQKERFKKLYYEIMKDVGRQCRVNDSSMGGIGGDGMDIAIEENLPNGSVSSNAGSVAAQAVSTGNVTLEKDRKYQDLEERLRDAQKQLKMFKSEYEDYRKEKLANDKIYTDQIHELEKERRELTSTNCRLMSSVEVFNEQMKLQEKNIAAYKKQIQTLEERNKTYDNCIAKHEQTIEYLRNEAMSANTKLGTMENKFEHLCNQIAMAKESEARLKVENQALHRERKNQSLLQNNLELIKTAFERSESEGRFRMEQRFDALSKECSALRRRLQEEQEHFRGLSENLQRQTDTAVSKLTDEQKQVELLEKELKTTRNDLESKRVQANELSAKLQEALAPSDFDENPIAKSKKKIKDLQMECDSKQAELVHLRKELDMVTASSAHYSKAATDYEQDLKDREEQFGEEKTKLEATIAQLQLSETSLKSMVEDLQSEIRLQVSGAQLNTNDSTTQLHKIQQELHDSLKLNSEHARELRDLRAECQMLKSSLQLCEKKYANEMQLHSSDVQALTVCKEELNKVQDQVAEMQIARDIAVANLKMNNEKWETQNKSVAEEKEHLEARFKDLMAQNDELHNQLEIFSSKMLGVKESLMNLSAETEKADISMNEDAANTSQSQTETDTKRTNEHLLAVIRFIRKEKNVAYAKLDISNSHCLRLSDELKAAQKELSESVAARGSRNDNKMVMADLALNSESFIKHEDILRKLATLNAITDSNRQLREERDQLAAQMRALTDRMTKMEDDLIPMQEKNRQLQTKTDEQAVELLTVQKTALTWRKRATDLVERNNKNPEDFKRLQNERESLAKMLTAEKEALRGMTEELTTCKSEKVRVDQELAAIQKQVQLLTDERKKLQDDFVALKQQHFKMTHELMELKNSALQKEDEVKKLSDEIGALNALNTDMRSKEAQLRKIAKRYKDQYMELKQKYDEMAADMGIKPIEEQASALGSGEASLAAAREAERQQLAKIEELTLHITANQDELERLRKENDALKKSDEKSQLAEAKSRISLLTEANKAVSRELQSFKGQLQSCEQHRSENDTVVQSLRDQISQLERQLADQETSHKESIARLTRENDTQSLRINNLHRQLGLQQGSKPATSSGAIEKSPSDPARTANVKPMAGPSVQQSATVNPRRGGDTPLASIRPMSVQNSRTAAVLPTSQTSNVSAVQGTSSSTTGSVTALVPPQQQVHTTGTSSADVMSSSPTSSHTDYMPATSSAVVVCVPPMGSATAESSQEAESVPIAVNEPTSQVVVQQQAVALVSPRIEVAPQNIIIPPQQSPQAAEQQQQQAASTSAGTSSSALMSSGSGGGGSGGGGGGSSSSGSSGNTTSSTSGGMSTHHQASSSNTVTTTQAGGHKRPREADGESSVVEESTSGSDKTSPQNKRTRTLASETAIGFSVSDVEYQVPTSSQRDQEDENNVIVVDSEEEDIDGGMVDGGTGDDGPFEDDADNGESYEMDEPYDQEQDDEGDGHDLDDDNVRTTDNNEVEIDDNSEMMPNQSETSANVGTSQVVGQSTGESSNVTESSALAPQQQNSSSNNTETQQIQTISSGSGEAGSSTPQSSWRQAVPPTTTSSRQQQQQQNLVIQQGYEEGGDDSIVPSTPTLYVPRRADG